ncbi:YbcC family protein [Chryseolinea soli]|uniref:Probable inorganic carbon transporter subunit DabA n=1 Tax=Chryseolinea soli TaxID=2321403 RepID=A0A385SVE9_9BACT|nr:DUF2309 domain-containing protein [Chryseolinea soli]AYB34281.1 DUF2309 domain-containing protein [Chryseolinea soli]
MKTHQNISFDEHAVLHDLKHYLPAQAPLKDFIHHNTLHAFQKLKFEKAIRSATEIFGYKVGLTLDEYRSAYTTNRIRGDILEMIITQRHGASSIPEWKEKALIKVYENNTSPRIGQLRANWKREYRMDLDSLVQPVLFRTLCSYLDQGISIWDFPVSNKSFLSALREMERNSLASFFHKNRAKEVFLRTSCEIADLLKVLVGDESLYAQYLYDQQFAHQGWSGMVSQIEDQPQTLLDHRQISLHDLIVLELLMEIDALDTHFGVANWSPLATKIKSLPLGLFVPVPDTEYNEVLNILQEAYEWSYYDEVLEGIQFPKHPKPAPDHKSFQAMFCIDDRECSLRRYLEKLDPACETFGTPGFFSVEFYYQPEDGKFYTKLCPAPVTPKYLIKEVGSKSKRQKDAHFSKHSHNFYSGWLISQTLGFWSAFKLFVNIFRPSMSPATASSFRHMDKMSRLTIENKGLDHRENDLQIGFTIEEMTNRLEGMLKSIGLVKDFAPVVYVIGHGSSSINNPHYAAYDCGACSGRAGSVNARVICAMANKPEVRKMLAERGITIPETTQFVGGIHDTTRDEIMFFDEASLSRMNAENHSKHEVVFANALDYNSKERSRRFESIPTTLSPMRIHEKVRTRSVSLFEPRPELNHATNALCIIGRRSLTKDVFLDRRSFLNSYDYRIDPQGNILHNVMKPVGPVCGGINLEYFFSRTDNQKMGAGTKLPHNVMGLFGVANGIDGDLRPGLPSQMIEVHDPIRLMVIVEQFPEMLLDVIQRSPEVYEWFINEWVYLAAVNPETRQASVFKEGKFAAYKPLLSKVDVVPDVTAIIETHHDNLPVYSLS